MSYLRYGNNIRLAGSNGPRPRYSHSTTKPRPPRLFVAFGFEACFNLSPYSRSRRVGRFDGQRQGFGPLGTTANASSCRQLVPSPHSVDHLPQTSLEPSINHSGRLRHLTDDGDGAALHSSRKARTIAHSFKLLLLLMTIASAVPLVRLRVLHIISPGRHHHDPVGLKRALQSLLH